MTKSNTKSANVTPKGNKSVTANAAAMTEAIVRDMAQERKSGEYQPTPEELAAKAAKAAVKNANRILNDTLKGYRQEHNDLKEHLKVFKKHLPAEYAALLQENWVALTIAVKRSGSCYTESVTTKGKDGKSHSGEIVHMCEWKNADHTLEIGRNITVTGYRYGSEDFQSVSSIKELTIEHTTVKDEYVSLGTINGVESFKKVTKTITKRLRPVEVLTIDGKDFERRMRKAWATIFPDGIEKITSK